ncbi:MAG TPA: arylsulfatase [Pricia sp.]|nr:arylsulfatase [Pricia sp.]
MNFLTKLFLIVLLMFLPSSCKEENRKKSVAIDQRPNIVLIMSDDMGYSDIAPYGGEIETPRLAKLAQNGLKFSQFYNAARCCPTRAALMTGCYPHQTGIGHMTNPPSDPQQHDYGVPEYQGFLNTRTVTLAEVLKEAGYRTLMTGKWHLGLDKNNWPLQRGFDKFYGIIPGACDYFKPVHPRGITVDNDRIAITDPDYYTTDAFTDQAIQFINNPGTREDNAPFFLYLAYNAPHWPLQAPQEVIDKYKGRYGEGWSKIREERYARMKEMGLLDADWELTPQDARDWDSLDDEKKKEMDVRMATYAAMIDRMDQNIGKLVDSLKAKGQLENTVILFLNDNGACAEFSELGNGPAENLETKKGGITLGRAWANAANTPYREYKHWVHEGGIATPFIVHWPKGIPKKRRGGIVHEYGFLPDIMATCLELSGATYPDKYNGNTILPISGKSLVPLFKGEAGRLHTEPIFWEHEGNKAVRLGKYKLVQLWEEGKKDNWELYDMEQDRTEMHDLIEKMPEKAEELISLYTKWAQKNKVLPWDKVLRIRAGRKK